jgi:molybdopterin-guanine dinucleotide biosynthesis protein A
MTGVTSSRGSRRRALTGLVVCGGAGTRMGRDKALLDVEGEPLVLRVARRLAEAADPVLLASGRPGRFGKLASGFAEVADRRLDAGPLAGIMAGLEASPHPLVAVVAVDMPFASPAVFRLLAGLWDGQDAVVPVTTNGTEPLHAVYGTAALPAFRVALESGPRSLRGLLGSLRVRAVEPEEWRAADPEGRFATNLNREEDLSILP